MKLRNQKSRSPTKPILMVFLLLAFVNLVSALDVDFYDTYSGQSSSSLDRISWVDTFPPTYFTVLGVFNPINTPLCYCVNEDRNVDSVYEFCICKNSSARTSCSGVTPVFPVLDTTATSTWYFADVVDVYTDIGSGGNAFYETTKQIKRGQISYYCDIGSGCQLCGSTGDSANYDYYFIDETFNVCDFDGSDDYEIRGYYSVSNHVLVDSETCATGLVCDTDHDGQTSTNPTSKPSNPCKVDTGGPCTVSGDCWSNAVCDGAHFEYGPLCDGDLVDIVVDEYQDSCGGDGYLVTIDTSDQDNTCISQGYPSGYVCDPSLDDFFYDTESEAYNSVCRGGVGNSCTLDSDCVSYLDCVSGFCAYDVFAFYTITPDTNSLYKGNSTSFDPFFSFSSDDGINFACWKLDGVSVECNGDNTACTNQCGVISSNPDWETVYVKSWSSGGDFVVELTVGNNALYSDSYSESFCVSGDGNYCFSCSDGLQNDDETAIDWGGRCGFPYFIKCNNGVLDNVTNETSVDYGGACGSCDNSSLNSDEDLVFLIESGLIEYPFSFDQCRTSVNVKSGIIVFFLIIGSVIIIPLLFSLFLLLLILLFFGTGAIGLLVAGVRSRRSLLVLAKFYVDYKQKQKKK